MGRALGALKKFGNKLGTKWERFGNIYKIFLYMKYWVFFLVFCLLLACGHSGLKTAAEHQCRATDYLAWCLPAACLSLGRMGASGGRERKVQECSARGAPGALFGER